ncbi:MAG TPA: hypothetical protein VF120_04525 [Ktedonobacterales bacterium]
MSEYQRYEWMTAERLLTREQLAAVNRLSSHIEASSTHALVEYHWGDFKHNPIEVLAQYFDGFLYWANWGSHQVAFRFPRGVLPTDLLRGYNFDELATFTRGAEHDILDIDFGGMEGPDEWTEYELGSLMPIRDELMAGDLRPLYITWLGAERLRGASDDEEEYEIEVPPIPPGMDALTSAQQALAELLMAPNELLAAAARHGAKTASPAQEEADFAALVKLLPSDRAADYLVWLARGEPGLGHLLKRELLALRPQPAGTAAPEGERVTYATLLIESNAIKARWAREKAEQERLARERHLREVHDAQEAYWARVDGAVSRRTASGYDEATQLLIELRDAAAHFDETPAFEERFRVWVEPYIRRTAFIQRLRARQFALPLV